MSAIWSNNFLMNDENNVHAISKKQLPERKLTAKKQAFGELKNVMHNKDSVTPFKGSFANSSKSSLNNDFQKQHIEKNAKHNFEPQPKFERKTQQKNHQTVDKPSVKHFEDFGEDWDIPRKSCSTSCSKDLEEIWSEMNMLDSNFFEKFANGGDRDDYYDSDYDIDESAEANQILEQLRLADDLENTYTTPTSNDAQYWGFFPENENVDFNVQLPMDLFDL